MTLKRKSAIRSSSLIREQFPENFNPELAIITESHSGFLQDFNVIKEITEGVSDLTGDAGSVILADSGSGEVIIFKGRRHYYDGTPMRDLSHSVYSLRELGITKLLSIDECSILNPRFSVGEIALIYDQINLMGSNPLIGENDNEIGLRFPDMSEPYDNELFDICKNVLIDENIYPNESIYVGVTGPAGETDAEASFYRQIHGDILGYSLVPENIAAVHAGIRFMGIGLLTGNLIADRMRISEDTPEMITEKSSQNRIKAEEVLSGVIKKILSKI